MDVNVDVSNRTRLYGLTKDVVTMRVNSTKAYEAYDNKELKDYKTKMSSIKSEIPPTPNIKPPPVIEFSKFQTETQIPIEKIKDKLNAVEQVLEYTRG